MPIRKISPINNNSITQEEFNEIYFTNTTPVQLTDLDKTMPIFKKWSFDYFKEIGKNFMCQVSDNLNEPAKITRKLPISEYISLIQSGEKCPYMIGWSYQKDFHQLDEDFSLPKIQPFDFINTLPRHLQFRRQWILTWFNRCTHPVKIVILTWGKNREKRVFKGVQERRC